MRSNDVIPAIEYEAMVFGRHLVALPGRTRRAAGILDQSAYVLLSILQAGGELSIGELSAITRLDASTLNRQTAALLREGYVDRIADPEGGIARKFRMTESGHEVLREEREASRRILEVIIKDWNAEDREAFATLLMRMNKAVEQHSGRSWPRPHRASD